MRKEREMDPLEAKAVREQFERAGNLYQKLTDRQKKKVSALIRQLLERQPAMDLSRDKNAEEMKWSPLEMGAAMQAHGA